MRRIQFGQIFFFKCPLGRKGHVSRVTPTTDRITIVTYGEKARNIEEGNFILRREYPSEMLKEIALVDTLHINAVIKRHQELTENFIPVLIWSFL
ncbi:MAG: hypothetical protein R2880_15285 [Deinococcales bacterium]